MTPRHASKPPRPRATPSRAAAEFTLLELVLVIAIMASVAGAVVASLGGAEDQAAGDIARRDLLELRRAVLRFRADLGVLPGQGALRLASQGGAVPLANVPAWAQADAEAWHASPANWWQLFENPLRRVAPADPLPPDPLGDWDPDRRRGWRGPYVEAGPQGLVQVGAWAAPVGRSPWEPASPLPLVHGVPDPFLRAPVPVGAGAAAWSNFAWADLTTTAAARGAIGHRGRPYLLLDLHDERLARIVSLGRDGVYGKELRPDFTADPRPLVDPTSDDLGLFIVGGGS